MFTLNQMEIFYFVATWNSFSQAALDLGVSKGYVSTQITALEKNLGVKLLYRTTRHLSLTEEGILFLEFCTNIVREKKLAASLLKNSQEEPHGHLKITAPPSMCSTFLAQLLPKFQEQYPKMSLTIDSSSSVKNLLQHGIDIALRITHSPDENYVARLITTFNFVICATPEYLSKYGMPQESDELLQHNCLIYSADPVQNHWPFQLQGSVKIMTVQGNLVSANSSIIKNALLRNKGIARLPEYIVADEILENKLIVLFNKNVSIKMPIYAIYSSNIKLPPKIKCFVQFLKENLTLA
ncbi:LysR family transcriptional regulator [Legionella sp. CNM-1927-20]|uniref:LysR family transcriptional regulator n=1 Tax=Legionella sp. CNM-1927-20 TaxID=3422221 RepID=UPI00403AC5E7